MKWKETKLTEEDWQNFTIIIGILFAWTVMSLEVSLYYFSVGLPALIFGISLMSATIYVFIKSLSMEKEEGSVNYGDGSETKKERS